MAFDKETMEEAKANMRLADESIPELQKDLQKAEKAGVDVSGMREKLQELKLKVRQFQSVFGK